MADSFCPECEALIETDAINIGEGVALCRACGSLSRLSDVVSGSSLQHRLEQPPPAGCSIERVGRDVHLSATMRSLGGFFGLLFVTLFWNGIVSVFVLIAASGLYAHLVGPVPDWFPAPEQDEPQSLGLSIFLCIFLIPFVTVGFCLFAAMLGNMFGKVRVIIGPHEARMYTGIGLLSWRKRFDPSTVHSVEESTPKWQSDNNNNLVIKIVADHTVKFGSLLSEERREWLQAVLHKMLINTDANDREEIAAKLSRKWGGR